jgi:hypothetical protein
LSAPHFLPCRQLSGLGAPLFTPVVSINSTLAIHAIRLLALVSSSLGVSAAPPVIHWGEAQHGVQLGIGVIQGFGKNGSIAVYVRPAANYAKNLVVPAPSQRFEVSLRDSSNNLAEPKPGATKFGAQLETRMSGRDKIRRELRFLDEEGWPLGGPRIDDCFLLKESGDYELEVKVRLLKETGEKLVPVMFSPMKMKLHVVANTLKPLPLKK